MTGFAHEVLRVEVGVPVDGVAEAWLTAVDPEGVPRPVASWVVRGMPDPSTAGPNESLSGRLLVSRSPDREHLAVALGTTLATFRLADGALVAGVPIEHSRPSVVIGWLAGGVAVAVDTAAPDGFAVPFGDGWTLRASQPIDQDFGDGQGHWSGAMGVFWPEGMPLDDVRTEIARMRAERSGPTARRIPVRIAVERDARETVLVDDVISLADGFPSITWPPVAVGDGVLLRRTLATSRLVEPRSDIDPGILGIENALEPWLVTGDGVVAAIPVELSQAPLCALSSGALLLPGADPLSRDTADEPLTVLALDGSLATLAVAGAPLTPSRVARACAPDLLPGDEAGEDEGERADEWSGDDGLWFRAARPTASGEALVVLLTGPGWWPGPQPLEPCDWLVALVPLGVDAPIELVDRGHRAAGTQIAIAL